MVNVCEFPLISLTELVNPPIQKYTYSRLTLTCLLYSSSFSIHMYSAKGLASPSLCPFTTFSSFPDPLPPPGVFATSGLLISAGSGGVKCYINTNTDSILRTQYLKHTNKTNTNEHKEDLWGTGYNQFRLYASVKLYSLMYMLNEQFKFKNRTQI